MPFNGDNDDDDDDGDGDGDGDYNDDNGDGDNGADDDGHLWVLGSSTPDALGRLKAVSSHLIIILTQVFTINYPSQDLDNYHHHHCNQAIDENDLL